MAYINIKDTKDKEALSQVMSPVSLQTMGIDSAGLVEMLPPNFISWFVDLKHPICEPEIITEI